MFDYIRYRIHLAKLNKEFRRLLAKAESIERSYKQGENDQGHISFAYQECFMIEKFIEYRKTCYYTALANRLGLPMPSNLDETIYMSFDFGDENGPKKILTEKGLHLVREKIRSERKARRDVVSFWFSVTTGLIGAVIGLISVGHLIE